MKALLLGTMRDVRGFGLAGFAGTPCDSARDVEQALAADVDRETAVVVLSPEVARLAPEAVQACAARRPVVVLSEEGR